MVIGLALVTGAAWLVLQRTTRSWFERDLALRAKLAVAGARAALVERWNPDEPADLSTLLSEITLDERVMGAAACDVDHGLIARTAEYPERFNCADVDSRVVETDDGATFVASLRGGEVFVSVVEVTDGPRHLGRIVIVQDLSYVARREQHFRNMLLVGFAILAVAGAVVTLLAARLSLRSFREDLRRLLRGDSRPATFHPLLADVRDLVDRLVTEREGETEMSGWSPGRLKLTLANVLHGERVIVLANREPYIHEHRDGGVVIQHPASGLVTALEPVLRACSGVWIAHGSGSADRETADANNRLRVPPDEESYWLRRVWLTKEQEHYLASWNEGT